MIPVHSPFNTHSISFMCPIDRVPYHIPDPILLPHFLVNKGQSTPHRDSGDQQQFFSSRTALRVVSGPESWQACGTESVAAWVSCGISCRASSRSPRQVVVVCSKFVVDQPLVNISAYTKGGGKWKEWTRDKCDKFVSP